ncbi:MAG: glycosyltransferase, partial [bacterium]
MASGGGSLAAGLRPGVRPVEGELDGVRTGLPRAAWLIHKVLREGGHRAVICNSVATTLIARAAAPSGQVPIVNVAHGWPAAGYPRVGKALRAADRVVAVSDEVRQRLIAAGMPPKSVVVVQNGVDLTPLGPRSGEERARLRAELGAGPDDVLAIAVGRLEQQKAHQHVFPIAERLMASLPRL